MTRLRHRPALDVRVEIRGELPREDPEPVPRLDLRQADRQLRLTGRPFVFHADPGDGRGRVLYRRYDGHYGLIAPVADGG